MDKYVGHYDVKYENGVFCDVITNMNGDKIEDHMFETGAIRLPILEKDTECCMIPLAKGNDDSYMRILYEKSAFDFSLTSQKGFILDIEKYKFTISNISEDNIINITIEEK